jgi:hypothetical protein
MEKKTFEFYVDVETPTWWRYRYAIEASSEEEATALVKEAFKSGGFDEIGCLDESVEDFDGEYLYGELHDTGVQQLYTEDGTFISQIE